MPVTIDLFGFFIKFLMIPIEYMFNHLPSPVSSRPHPLLSPAPFPPHSLRHYGRLTPTQSILVSFFRSQHVPAAPSCTQLHPVHTAAPNCTRAARGNTGDKELHGAAQPHTFLEFQPTLTIIIFLLPTSVN